MSRLVSLIACLAFTFCLGCGDDDKSAKRPKPQKPNQTKPVDAPIADEDLAVPADFEDEADEQITAETYKAELDTLEQEIAEE